MSHPARISSTRPDPLGAGDSPSLGDALEHVVEAGQDLVVRRIDLQAERILERGRHALAASLVGIAAAIVALVGWLLFLAGAVDALSLRFPRNAVEMTIGLTHLAVGIAVALLARRSAALAAGVSR